LARLRGAVTVRDAHGFRRIAAQPGHRVFGADIDTRAARVRDHLRGFLVEALDALVGVGMDDRTAAGRAVDNGDVLLDAIEGLHLEAPPVGPERAADAVAAQPVGDLV